MPTLGKKKFAYTKKGKAAYKAAKKKGNKMNESIKNRLVDLMVEMKIKSAIRGNLQNSFLKKNNRPRVGAVARSTSSPMLPSTPTPATTAAKKAGMGRAENALRSKENANASAQFIARARAAGSTDTASTETSTGKPDRRGAKLPGLTGFLSRFATKGKRRATDSEGPDVAAGAQAGVRIVRKLRGILGKGRKTVSGNVLNND